MQEWLPRQGLKLGCGPLISKFGLCCFGGVLVIWSKRAELSSVSKNSVKDFISPPFSLNIDVSTLGVALSF